MNTDILIQKRDLQKRWKLVPLSYNFQKYNGPIKYITKKNITDKEKLNPLEFKYINKSNDYFILRDTRYKDNNSKDYLNEGLNTIKVLTCLRNKLGEIIYSTEFYIKKDYKPNLIGGGETNLNKNTEQNLNDTIKYQQDIIEKLIQQIKDHEIKKYKLIDENNQYKILFDENNNKYEKLLNHLNESKQKIEKYELLIHQLINSHKES